MTNAVQLAQYGSVQNSFKNRIINGAMVIDQRNAGASVTVSSGSIYTLDRFAVVGSQASKFTVEQTITGVAAPTGFSDYLGITSLSAYSVLAADYFTLQQTIEGFNIADLAWGTASATTVTLSFKVYSSLTGTFGGAIYNSAGDRSYPFTYSITTANTWTTISITIAGDTSGTWLTTNGVGVRINWGLGVGSTISGTAGAWSSTFYRSATGATSVVGTSGATFYITGVQLEKGSTATSFDYRPYGTELSLCQRYYQQLGNVAYVNVGTGFQQSTTIGTFYIKYNTTMRVSPTFSVNNLIVSDRFSFDLAVSANIQAQAGLDSAYINVTNAAGGASRYPVFLAPANATTGYLSITAEF